MRFELLHELGHGGMGVVYKARDTETGAVVALKRLKAGAAFAADEVLLAKTISHPNVCQVYELLEEEDRTSISMEFVDGESLQEYLKRRGPLSIDETLYVAGEVLNGLEAAHHAGIVHRDLNPQNILIASNGRRISEISGAGKQRRGFLSDCGEPRTPQSDVLCQLRRGQIAKFGPAGGPIAGYERIEGTRVPTWGFWSGSHPSSGPFERDRVCSSGGRQRWRAGRQTEPLKNFLGGVWRMNRGENAEPAVAAGAFQHGRRTIIADDRVFIVSGRRSLWPKRTSL